MSEDEGLGSAASPGDAGADDNEDPPLPVLPTTAELDAAALGLIRRLARAINNIKVLTLCGGMPFGPQVGSLEHGVHIVVGTPGRIDDHLRKGTLKLESVNMVDQSQRQQLRRQSSTTTYIPVH